MVDDINNILQNSYENASEKELYSGRREIQQELFSARRNGADSEHIAELNAVLKSYQDQLKVISQIETKYSEMNKDIRNLAAKNYLFQQNEEEKLAKSTLDKYKALYQYKHDSDRQLYKKLDEQEANIYKTALENNRELTRDELKALEEIEKARLQSEENVNKQKEKNLEKYNDVAKKSLKKIFEFANEYTNIMYFDQAKKGMTDFAQAYEQNFTELAGRMGTDRNQTHNIIGSGLTTVSNDSVLSGALNFSSDVMPTILEASKAGFMNDEAIEVGISRAVDKKLMPWLETSSETWTNLEYSMSDDSLMQLKGQQLLLHETREGNRILQEGVANTLLEKLEPTLLNIESNTTDVTQLSRDAQLMYSNLREQGYGKQEALQLTNKVIDAYKDPVKALSEGDSGDIYLGNIAYQGGNLEDLFKGISDLSSMAEGSGALGYFVSKQFGISTNGMSRTDEWVSDINAAYEKFIVDREKYENLSPEEYEKLYTSNLEKLGEKVTATQEHDNKIQNDYAKQILNALKKPHGSDIQIKIFEEVVNIKDWLIKSFIADKVSNLVGKGINKWLNAKGSGTTSGIPSTASGGGFVLNKGLIKGTSIVGAAVGAGIGIYQAYDNSNKYTAMSLNNKDAAKDTAEYEAYKKTLEDKHNAKVTGAVTGGVIGGVAGAAGGIWAGAAAGAAVGTVVPGIGNAVGAVVGGVIGLIGGLVGAKVGEAVGDAVSPLQTVLSDAAVESLNNLDIMKQNWNDEVLERQNLVSAMRDTTDIEVQKRMLLDAGIDSNLVNMAKTDEALDSLAQSALKYAEDNSELANAAQGLTVSINNTAVADTFDQLKSTVLGRSSADRRSELENILAMTNMDSETRESIQKDIDGSWWWGTTDNDVEHILKRIMSASDESSTRAIAGNYKLTYDNMNMTYLNELNSAIQNGNKDAAIDAINMLKNDKINGGGTAWDSIKQNEEYKSALANLGINVSQYKLGSTFIPYDQLALVHAGERVLTAGQNKEYTNELVSGNSSASIIQTGVQDIVMAIKTQTSEIINYLATMNFNNSPFGSSHVNMLPTMGNTKVTV